MVTRFTPLPLKLTIMASPIHYQLMPRQDLLDPGLEMHCRTIPIQEAI